MNFSSFFMRGFPARAVAICSVCVLFAPALSAQPWRIGATDTTFAVDRGSALDVTATSAEITVRAWTRSEMSVTGGTRSNGVHVTKSARVVHVELRGGDGNVEVRVPRGTRVAIHSQNGGVQVLDVGGAVDADVVSGDVTVKGGAERCNVSVASGDVRVSNVEGSVHVEAISGDIVLDDVRGDVDVSGTSSDVTLRRVNANHVNAQLVSGSVTFDGVLATNGRYEFNTHSGDVHMFVPDGSKGSLEVQSFNGDVHTGIPVTTIGGAAREQLQSSARGSRNSMLRGPQRFEFGGGGGAQIIISTFSGDIDISRGPRRTN